MGIASAICLKLFALISLIFGCHLDKSTVGNKKRPGRERYQIVGNKKRPGRARYQGASTRL
ncbi:MAG: hypothetical protein WBG73_13055 [Coleofasciculaceae cyanobacterium]